MILRAQYSGPYLDLLDWKGVLGLVDLILVKYLYLDWLMGWLDLVPGLLVVTLLFTVMRLTRYMFWL